MKTNKAHLDKSEVIKELPLVCSDELKAVEFFERKIWQGKPHCAHCQSTKVYKMVDAKTGERNKRFLWRCHDCKKQFTVRIGTVLEESRIPFRHWAYAFWRAVTSKKGVSALEIKRQCQISYPAALFLMHRIRFAMTPDDNAPKLKGRVEADETFIGGKPRPFNYHKGIARRTKKAPVFAMVERDGNIRRLVVPTVSARNLRAALAQYVDRSATLLTDENPSYLGSRSRFEGGHFSVHHKSGEYVAFNGAHINTAESSFAILKRGINGIYHAVSKKHLHRYVGEFDFRWNTRKLNDGDRTVAAIRAASGKRLDYRTMTQ
jgi:transposase-like protein